MKKLFCFIVGILFLIPVGINEKNKGNNADYSFPPVALMEKYIYKGRIGKEIVFDASASYD